MPLQPRTLAAGKRGSGSGAARGRLPTCPSLHTCHRICIPAHATRGRFLPFLASASCCPHHALFHPSRTATHPPKLQTPNPSCDQSCGWRGGVWDDRDIVDWATAGGRCLTREEADKVLAEDSEAEEVTVTASSDGNVTGGRCWPGGPTVCDEAATIACGVVVDGNTACMCCPMTSGEPSAVVMTDAWQADLGTSPPLHCASDWCNQAAPCPPPAPPRRV